VKIKSRCKLVEIMLKTGKKLKCAEFMNTAEISEEYEELEQQKSGMKLGKKS